MTGVSKKRLHPLVSAQCIYCKEMQLWRWLQRTFSVVAGRPDRQSRAVAVEQYAGYVKPRSNVEIAASRCCHVLLTRRGHTQTAKAAVLFSLICHFMALTLLLWSDWIMQLQMQPSQNTSHPRLHSVSLYHQISAVQSGHGDEELSHFVTLCHTISCVCCVSSTPQQN